MSKKSAQIYQIKITLHYSKPPIWRRLLISSETSLAKLHDIIQIAMGWDDSHLHMFRIYDQAYSNPFDEGFLVDLNALDGRKVKLSQLITAEGEKFVYEYDFGDSWEHDILIEKILPPDPKQQLPVCIKGKRACPPDDVGGVWGYESFLEAIKDPQHPEYEMFIEWIDGDFDSEAFDLEAVNRVLQTL